MDEIIRDLRIIESDSKFNAHRINERLTFLWTYDEDSFWFLANLKYLLSEAISISNVNRLKNIKTLNDSGYIIDKYNEGDIQTDVIHTSKGIITFITKAKEKKIG